MAEPNRGGLPYLKTDLSNTKVEAVSHQARLFNVHIFNPGAVLTYVQFFDALAANVTVGTTVPTFVRAVPPGGGVDGNAYMPMQFDAGITIAATTTPTGSSAPATAILINFDTK